jgi:DNA-binding Xre family transcriptional regulator
MATTTKSKATARQVFLLDTAIIRRARFAALRPNVVSTAGDVRRSVDMATKHSLWVCYAKSLTDMLVKSASGPSRILGKAVFVHALQPQSIPALNGYFQRIAFAPQHGFLPPDELAETLHAENASELFIGGSIDSDNQTVTLWRGDLEPLTVPFSAFEKSGDGTVPDFTRFSLTDFGQTIRLGKYEAASDTILYEFDPDYRRRLSRERQASEQSFGASLRRLRKQRGMRREDFAPEIASKTIARIEQGKVQRIHQTTLDAIAKRLQVRPDEIETF